MQVEGKGWRSPRFHPMVSDVGLNFSSVPLGRRRPRYTRPYFASSSPLIHFEKSRTARVDVNLSKSVPSVIGIDQISCNTCLILQNQDMY